MNDKDALMMVSALASDPRIQELARQAATIAGEKNPDLIFNAIIEDINRQNFNFLRLAKSASMAMAALNVLSGGRGRGIYRRENK